MWIHLKFYLVPRQINEINYKFKIVMEKVTNEQSQEILRDADPTQLSENAFRELADGEEYRPVMHPERNYPEVTPYSVSMGLILAVIFSAAAAYLGLRVGQVFEAAIPISIIAVGL